MTNLISGLIVTAVLLPASIPSASFAQELRTNQHTGSLFSISGQVVDTHDGYYVLRPKDGRTRIRFQFHGRPSDFAGDRPVLSIGDDVTAIGRLDADTLTVGGVLDVVSVYNEDRRAYFALGEPVQGVSGGFAPIIPPSSGFGPDGSQTSLVGVVSEVGEQELTLTAGEVRIPVKISSLLYNPFDAIGGQRLGLGDMVMVEGVLEPNLENEPLLQAHRLTRIFVFGPAS